MDHYLYLTGDDCIELYPDNESHRFTVQLPRELDLSGTWYCALKELYFKGDFSYSSRGGPQTPTAKPKRVYLCTDLVEDAVVGDSYAPVLRRSEIRVNLERTYQDDRYSKVKVPRVKQVTVYVLDQELNPVRFKQGVQPLSCLLHLTKRCPPGRNTL